MGHDEFVFHAYRWAWSLDLPSSTKLVLLALCDHVNRDDRSCYPSWVGIEKMTGLARRTVARAISALVDDGVISTDPRPGKTNRYLLNLPSDPCHHDTGTRATVAPKDIYKNKTPYRGGSSNTAVTIPDDWQPSEAVLERIKAAGLPHPTPAVVLHFVSHYRAKGSRHADWDALFITWCIREQRIASQQSQLAPAATGKPRRSTPMTNDDWIARGRRVGITARPGESTEQFAARVRAAEERASL